MQNNAILSKNINKEIRDIHENIASEIEARLREFRNIWENGSERELFIELVFCLLTPQSSARRCGRALENLIRNGALFEGSSKDICRELAIVRFHNNKTRYIIEARQKFCPPKGKSIRRALTVCGGSMEMREWLYRDIKGIGFKEASHFLRNIGRGHDLAILDRHILKNMCRLGLIGSMPNSLTPARYLIIENLLKKYSRAASIPLDHLDFVLWYRNTGDIFK
jgi:N-glycosylase/DNA lyase